MRIFFNTALLLAMNWCFDSHVGAAERLSTASEAHGTTQDATAKANLPLELLPPQDGIDADTVRIGLMSSKWRYAPPKTILGQGFERDLDFKTPQNNELVLTTTTRSFPRVNDRPAVVKEAAVTQSCVVDGPVLKYGIEVHSFVVIPNQVLILNAIVPLGHGKWYYANRHRIYNNNPKYRDWDEHVEYLFEFQDDPLKNEKGRAVVHYCLRGETKVIPSAFSVKSDEYGKHIRFEKLYVGVTLSHDAKYGLLDEINLDSIVYSPIKADDDGDN